MDTYGDAGGYGDVGEFYGGGGAPEPADTNRIGGTGAIRKPPRSGR